MTELASQPITKSASLLLNSQTVSASNVDASRPESQPQQQPANTTAVHLRLMLKDGKKFASQIQEPGNKARPHRTTKAERSSNSLISLDPAPEFPNFEV